MAWTDILTFSIVASLLVMPPGPNGALIAKTVPISGRLAGFANVVGFVIGFYLHGLLAILGISVILVNSATAFAIVKYLGAAYLCWIGIKALIASFRRIETVADIKPAKSKRTLTRAFFEGLLTNALNPKVSMFYLAAFPQFVTIGETTISASIMLVVIHSMIAAIWFGTMVLVFSRLTTLAKSDRFQRWLKGVTGAVFVGFGLKLAAYKPNL